jgi:uncharacterized membrane protein
MGGMERGAGRQVGDRASQWSGRGAGQEFGQDSCQNVGQYERIASGIGGAAMMFLGLRRMSIGGVLAAIGGAALLHRGVTGRCRVYRRFGIDTTREGLSRGVEVDRAITIGRSPEEVYRFWRNVEDLPRFMQHLSSVTEIEQGRTRWVAREAGIDIEWYAQIIEDVPGERIMWRSEPGGRVETEGEITFRPAPGDRGTEVRVRMRCAAPGGVLAMAMAPLLRRFTRIQVGQDLHRLKQLMETGEVATGAMRREQGERSSRQLDQEREAGGVRYQRDVSQRGEHRNGRGVQP